MKKVLVIINKSWEADPVIHALTATKIRPSRFPNIEGGKIDVPPLKNAHIASLTFKPAHTDLGVVVNDQVFDVKFWCIEDIMNPKAHPSSSEEKAHCLQHQVFTLDHDADLVIAFGTAGFNDRITSFNGSVVVGAEFLTYNAVDNNPQSNFRHSKLGQFIPSNLEAGISKQLFSIFSETFKSIVEAKLLPTPNMPSIKNRVMAAENFVALSNVNITNYNDYAWADEAGLQHYHDLKVKSPIGSIETTHGVIRLSTQIPTIFVSAISDRLGYFSSEVTATQNYVASFNGGIFLSYFLKELATVSFQE